MEWREDRKFVLESLTELKATCNSIRKDQVESKIIIAKLQVKAGIWGLLGGAFPVAIGLVIWFLKSQ